MKMFFTTDEAAEYLKLKVTTIRYHLYTTQKLRADERVGNSLMLSRNQLDEFEATPRPVGRPKEQVKGRIEL